jgi:hypothetical protein
VRDGLELVYRDLDEQGAVALMFVGTGGDH